MEEKVLLSYGLRFCIYKCFMLVNDNYPKDERLGKTST